MVPRWAYALIAAAVATAVVVVLLGRHRQHDRLITDVVSATVSKTNPHLHTTLGPVTLKRSAAAKLAAQLNGLPRPFSGTHGCPAETGGAYIVRFETGTGSTVQVTVEATGCSDVTLNATSWDRTDRNATVRTVLERDLRS